MSRFQDCRPLIQSVTLVAVLVLTVCSTSAATADGSPGKQLFLDYKCNMCHTVDAFQIERTSKSEKLVAMDLSAAGEAHDLDWFVKFIKKDVDREGALHKKTFRGTDDEVQAIAEWLTTLENPDESVE